MLSTLSVLLALLLICGAAAVDWGAVARGAGGFYRGLLKRHEARFTLSAKWSVECGPIVDGKLVPHTRRELAPNLIVDAGLEAAKDLLLNSATAKVPFGWMAMGTDATAEASGQTALGAQTAIHAANYTSGGTGVATLDWTFPAGVGTGAITEAGLFNAAAAGDMLNRKTWIAVPKGAGDALKIICVVTLAPA